MTPQEEGFYTRGVDDDSEDILARDSGKKSKPIEVRNAIVELYLNVKIRSAEEIKNLDED